MDRHATALCDWLRCNLVKYRTFSPPRIKKNKKEKKKYRILGASIQLINIKGGTKRKYLIKNKYKIYVYETTNLFDMFFFLAITIQLYLLTAPILRIIQANISNI